MTQTVKKDLAEAREVCPTTARRLLGEGALLLDVREADEVAAVGYGGCEMLNIPLSQFEARWAETPRDRDVIVACVSGARSLKAAYFLMYQGYDQVMNMRPGIARWAGRGFPVTGDAAAAARATEGSACGCGAAAPEPAASGSCCGGDGAGSGCC